MTQQTETTITPSEVKQAWRLAIAAADRHEDEYSMESREAMLEATDYAERLQALYDEQYEQWVTS
jgi:hypothetical protein